MELYRNSRDGRLTWLCRGMLAGSTVFLLWGLYGLVANDTGALAIGSILGAIIFIAALALAAYGSKFVLAIREENDELVIQSWRLIGAATTRVKLSAASLGPSTHLETDIGVPTDTTHAWLSINGGKSYLLDFTDDPDAGDRLSKVLSRRRKR